jgi:hypothetical protein
MVSHHGCRGMGGVMHPVVEREYVRNGRARVPTPLRSGAGGGCKSKSRAGITRLRLPCRPAAGPKCRGNPRWLYVNHSPGQAYVQHSWSLCWNPGNPKGWVTLALGRLAPHSVALCCAVPCRCGDPLHAADARERQGRLGVRHTGGLRWHSHPEGGHGELVLYCTVLHCRFWSAGC